MRDEAALIRARRAESNRAIAARDAERVVALMMPDVTVSVAGGSVLTGPQASRDAFVEQFADRSFRGYVREADEIHVSDDAQHATERGRWTGTWRSNSGAHDMHGTYSATWRRTELGWFIASEVFVQGLLRMPR